jgi:hypothetical protein
MKDYIKIVLGGLFSLAAALGIGFGLQYFGLITTKFFAPKFESVRRETFENSKAYNQGMVQEIENLYVDYLKASPEHRGAIGKIILHRTSDFDRSKLSPEIQQVIRQAQLN